MLESFKPFTGLAVWLLAALTGITSLWIYSQRPGGFGQVPQAWPERSSLVVDGAGMQLVMFVHPQCPCSRASLGELAVLMRHCPDGLSARVLFIRPEGQSIEWVRSHLWQQAERIPNVLVEVDADGVEAARFGAETSGATMVYDATGELVFHGGITAARGHFGDNVGRIAIQQLSEGREAQGQTAVFGCPLNDAPCDLGALCQRDS